jgi:hypothetical protein
VNEYTDSTTFIHQCVDICVAIATNGYHNYWHHVFNYPIERIKDVRKTKTNMFMKNLKNTRLKLSGTILIVVLSLMALTPSEAQAQHAKAGIKGGVNFSNSYKGDPDDKNARVGFHGGFLCITT